MSREVRFGTWYFMVRCPAENVNVNCILVINLTQLVVLIIDEHTIGVDTLFDKMDSSRLNNLHDPTLGEIIR